MDGRQLSGADGEFRDATVMQATPATWRLLLGGRMERQAWTEGAVWGGTTAWEISRGSAEAKRVAVESLWAN